MLHFFVKNRHLLMACDSATVRSNTADCFICHQKCLCTF